MVGRLWAVRVGVEGGTAVIRRRVTGTELGKFQILIS